MCGRGLLYITVAAMKRNEVARYIMEAKTEAGADATGGGRKSRAIERLLEMTQNVDKSHYDVTYHCPVGSLTPY